MCDSVEHVNSAAVEHLRMCSNCVCSILVLRRGHPTDTSRSREQAVNVVHRLENESKAAAAEVGTQTGPCSQQHSTTGSCTHASVATCGAFAAAG